MPTVSIQHLIRENMFRPVRHNVRLDGAHSGQPGVTAIIARSGKLGWCLLADHRQFEGVSVTNGGLEYAEAVCRALDCSVLDLAWFELDSVGDFDELQVHGNATGWAALLEDGHPPRSLAAFKARVSRLPAGLPEEAAAAVQACFERLKA